MERAEYNRHSRARMGRNGKRRVEHATPCNAGRAGAHRPSEALRPTRSSDVLPRIARERVLKRVPSAPQRNCVGQQFRRKYQFRWPAAGNGWDIGAYEYYPGAGNVPAPPTNLRIVH